MTKKGMANPTDLLPPLSLESPNMVRKIAGLGFYSRFYMYITIAISNGYWPLRTGSYMYMIYCCLC